jgi:hypothetical protein
MTCRTAAQERDPGSHEVIVFASTFEEAISNSIFDGGYHNFTFLAANSGLIPSITCPVNYAPDTPTHIEFDWSLSPPAWKLTISGSDITDTVATDVKVLIGGLEQTVASVSSTELVVIIDNLDLGENPLDLVIYFSEGIPDYDTTPCPALVFTPEIIELSTTEGSAAGAVIYAHVAGVGPADASRIMLVDQTNADVCSEIEIPEYGVVKCRTLTTSTGLTAGLLTISVKDTSTSTIYPQSAGGVIADV